MAQAALAEIHDPAPAGSYDVLVETIEALSLTRNVEEIAAVVRTGARRLTGADGVAVVVRDEDRCHYLDEDSIAPLWKGLKFPMSACISGWAMIHGETAVIPDIYVDDRIPHDAYRPTFVKSLVMTPVRPNDPVAAIGAYWKETRQPTGEEISALKAMARATATAFENARLVASLTESVERRDFLIRELDHRVKNTLASVQAIARQTLKTAPDQASFVDAFSGRLAAMSRAHELLTRKSWKGARLDDAARQALAPFSVMDRIDISGPPVDLGPAVAVGMQLALHELAINAMKYGALSSTEGRVKLSWRVVMETEPRRLILNWTESGGPPVATPTRRGMGSQLIERGLPHTVQGEGRLDFQTDGLRFELICDLSSQVTLA